MIEIYDFNNFPQNTRFYGGASGPKYGITINNEDYILKFPQNIGNFRMEFPASYSTNAFSEYIGSHFYEYMGLPVHETLLGKSGKHLAVACKDFCRDDFALYEFYKISNAYIGSDELPSPSGMTGNKGVILEEILEVIDYVPHLEGIREVLKNRFWDMFIIDSLIANPDRNGGNWGILIPIKDRRMAAATLAPIFDNGNSLNSKFTDVAIENHFNKDKKERIESYLRTASIFQKIDAQGNPHKINPYSYILKHENSDCDKALLRLKDRIPLAIERIFMLVDNIPLLSQNRKDFYKESIECRYNYGIYRAIEDLSRYEMSDSFINLEEKQKISKKKDSGGLDR